jgi:type VI secretion system protein ImpH
LFLVFRHYRRDLRYAAGASDPLSLAVGSLFGLLPQTDAMPERTRVMLMPYTGLLAMGSRSARSSAGILSHVLGVPAGIEEFVPRRIDLPHEARFRLGGGLELGVETLLGESIADVTGHCRIWLGPLPFDRFLTFLPDSPDYGDLLHLIDFVVNEPLSRDLGFVIEAQSVPGWALGEGKLGWTTWAEPPQHGTIDTIMAAGA